MFSCFTEVELRQCLTGELPTERRSGAQEHLRSCPTCAALWDEVRDAHNGASLNPHHLPTQVQWTDHPDWSEHEQDAEDAEAGPPPSPTLGEFLASLSASGLLLPAEVAKVREQPAADPQSGAAVADLIHWLIEQDKLTRYQAELLCRGRAGGLVLGNYILLDKIGQGGMGTVFKARHRRMTRLVALKVLPASLSRIPEAIARFQREVEAAARLQHPHVAAAYDADEAEGVHFLVMEFVDGPNLASYVRRRGPLSVAAAVRLTAQAARGLAAAHAVAIVHRDIKPSNLMVNRQGMLKVLDLGLAQVQGSTLSLNWMRPLDLTSDVTQTGRTMGTVDYMAPEQARDAKAVDARADIYSLGCTLYYLLAGHPPAPPGSAAEKLLWHQSQQPPPLSDVCPGVTARLEATARRMMAKDPAARQQSMIDVALELDACLAELSPAAEDLSLDGIELPLGDPSSTYLGSRADRGTMLDAGDTLRSVAGISAAGISAAGISPLDTTQPNQAPSRGRRLALAIGAIGLAVLAGVALAPLLPGRGGSSIQPATDGLLVVLVDQGPADVLINGRFVGIAGKEGQPLELRLPPGGQFLEIRRAGYQSHQQRIESLAGETTRVAASLRKADPLPAPPAPQPGRSPHASYADLLAWVWRNGGSVAAVSGDGTQLDLARPADLPPAPVEITTIRLAGSGVQNRELAALAAAPRLRELSLAGTTISDEGLAHLAPLAHLTRLYLSETAIQGPGLVNLRRMTRLVELDLTHTRITDQALGNLLPLESLQRLHLCDTAITDAGIGQLRALSSLEFLALHNTGLSQSLHGTLVGENDRLEIKWDGADQQRAIAGRLLERGATLAVADLDSQLIADIRNRNALPSGRIVVKEVDLSTGIDFGDEDLKQLVSLSEIESLNLVNVDLSPAGLTYVQGLTTLRRVQVAAQRLSPAAASAFRLALPNCQVTLKLPVDAEVAMATLVAGGRVSVVTEQGPLEVASADMLPPGLYSIRAINLAGATRVGDESLAKLHELPGLEILALPDAPITDEGLRYLAGCKSLRELNLSGTQVTAAGLGTLARLPALARLYLARTRLGDDGLRQAAGLAHLTHLSLQQVPLADGQLALLKRLAQLQWLDLSGTSVDDAAVAHLAELGTLTRLDVRGAGLSDAGLEELRAACAARCEVSGDPPDAQRAAARWLVQHKAAVQLESGPLVNLKSLPRDACRIVAIDLAGLDGLHADDIVRHLAACPDLHSLDLSKTGLADADLEFLSRLPNLTTLRLAGVSISDRALKSLAGSSRLETLDLSSTRVTGSGLAELTSASGLAHLHLSHAPVRPEHLAWLTAFAKLQTLEISANQAIDDASLAPLERLSGLRTLGLRRASITDATLDRVARLTELESLDLDGTPVTDEGVEKLVGLTRLARLSLSRTGVTDGVTMTLAKMKSLRKVALLQTRVSPASIRALQAALPAGAEILAPTPREPGVPEGASNLGSLDNRIGRGN